MLGFPTRLLTPSKFGGTESCVPGNARGQAGVLAAPHRMSPGDAPQVCGPLTSRCGGVPVTMWDNRDSFFPTPLGNCCESHRGIRTKPLLHPRHPKSWGWRLQCSAQLSQDLYLWGISGLLARFSPLKRVLFAADVISLVRNRGRRDVVLPSPARGAIHPVGQPLPHSAGHRRWQRDLFSWDNGLCFYGRVIKQGDTQYILQAHVPLGQPEPLFRWQGIFGLFF